MMELKKIWLVAVPLIALVYHSPSQDIKPDIQYITLPDTFLIHALDSLIQYEEENDSLFSKGYGYLELYFSPKIRSGMKMPDKTRIDTVMEYGVYFNYMHPEEVINKFVDLYPNYYSIVRGRVIALLSDHPIDHFLDFSEKSKKLYLEKLERNLAPPGSPSLRYYRLNEVVNIYYLTNRFTGKNEKPVVVRKKYK